MKKLQFLITVLATFGSSVLTSTVSAQDSDGVSRAFAVGLGGSAILEGCPDWLSEDSRRLVVAGPEQSNGIELAPRRDGDAPEADWQIRAPNGDVILDIQNTAWGYAPTLHVTAGGPDVTPDYVWLEPVNAGTTCATGPDSDVLVQKSFLIKLIDDSTDPHDGKYSVVNDGGDLLFCVGIAVFNK